RLLSLATYAPRSRKDDRGLFFTNMSKRIFLRVIEKQNEPCNATGQVANDSFIAAGRRGRGSRSANEPPRRSGQAARAQSQPTSSPQGISLLVESVEFVSQMGALSRLSVQGEWQRCNRGTQLGSDALPRRQQRKEQTHVTVVFAAANCRLRANLEL